MTQKGDSATPLGRTVEWFYATVGHHVGGRGKVIAYCDAPQVLIEDEAGEKLWWRADLTRDITCEHCGGSGRTA